ncbi:MAG: hypothetical protein QOI57_3092 [Rubrobacteraceae bacterium]|jgi:hypothetical protein|nr:hypothetical protein [Rubrobacteraceae bacterium]
MQIELNRTFTPEDIGGEESCGICTEAFRVDVVRAAVRTEDRGDMGMACPRCVEVMGRYKPEKFPTLAEYEAALLHFPEPIFASVEELTREDPWLDHTESTIHIER